MRSTCAEDSTCANNGDRGDLPNSSDYSVRTCLKRFSTEATSFVTFRWQGGVIQGSVRGNKASDMLSLRKLHDGNNLFQREVWVDFNQKRLRMTSFPISQCTYDPSQMLCILESTESRSIRGADIKNKIVSIRVEVLKTP
jgi:hypothetical protein